MSFTGSDSESEGTGPLFCSPESMPFSPGRRKRSCEVLDDFAKSDETRKRLKFSKCNEFIKYYSDDDDMDSCTYYSDSSADDIVGIEIGVVRTMPERQRRLSPVKEIRVVSKERVRQTFDNHANSVPNPCFRGVDEYVNETEVDVRTNRQAERHLWNSAMEKMHIVEEQSSPTDGRSFSHPPRLCYSLPSIECCTTKSQPGVPFEGLKENNEVSVISGNECEAESELDILAETTDFTDTENSLMKSMISLERHQRKSSTIWLDNAFFFSLLLLAMQTLLGFIFVDLEWITPRSTVQSAIEKLQTVYNVTPRSNSLLVEELAQSQVYIRLEEESRWKRKTLKKHRDQDLIIRGSSESNVENAKYRSDDERLKITFDLKKIEAEKLVIKKLASKVVRQRIQQTLDIQKKEAVDIRKEQLKHEVREDLISKNKEQENFLINQRDEKLAMLRQDRFRLGKKKFEEKKLEYAGSIIRDLFLSQQSKIDNKFFELHNDLELGFSKAFSKINITNKNQGILSLSVHEQELASLLQRSVVEMGGHKNSVDDIQPLSVLRNELSSIESILNRHEEDLSQWEAALNKLHAYDLSVDNMNGNIVQEAIDELTNFSLVTVINSTIRSGETTIPYLKQIEACTMTEISMLASVKENTHKRLENKRPNKKVQKKNILTTEYEKITQELFYKFNNSASLLERGDPMKHWLEEQVLMKASSIIAESKTWVEVAVKNVGDLNEEEDENAKFDLVGLTRNEAVSEIVRGLDIEYAGDRTGNIDYASIRTGGQVIYELCGAIPGTTHNLGKTLPILDRFFSRVNLRFYGHTPEVALSVTTPRDALGQCWAFVSPNKKSDHCVNVSSDRLRSFGNIGTLTVKLAKAVQVKSVVIEHPPREITSHFGTAIHKFRVIGYDRHMLESRDASTAYSNEAHDLGSFIYDINGLRSLQEFEIPMSVDGKKLPKMQYIVLAIDSNWGSKISCLYRFRVHGDE